MGRLVFAWLLAVGISATATEAAGLERFQFTQTAMAVPVKLVLYAEDASTANRAAQAVFQRFHHLNEILSDYDRNSELRRLCATSGEGRSMPISQDLWTVLHAAQHWAKRSAGAFDVTVGPVVRQWRRARRRETLPPPDKLAESRNRVGYHLLRLDPERRSAQLLRPRMRLDLGGIAKGYALDEAMEVLRRHGITRALIDAGGDLVLGCPPPKRPGWLIGIAPLEADAAPSHYLWLSRRAIATSGDAWQFVEIDGRRYSHLVDPRTGVGLTDHSSVTVIAPTGMTADALASTVSVLGPQKGLALIDATPETAAFIVRHSDGSPRTYQSSRWRNYPRAEPESACSRPD